MYKLLVDRPNRAYDRMREPLRFLTFILTFMLLLLLASYDHRWWLAICAIGLWRGAYVCRNTGK